VPNGGETGMTRHTTFCRLCSPLCGLVVDVDDGRVVDVRGDVAHPVTAGFTCTKGRQLGVLHHRPDRLLHPLSDGEPVAYDVAVAEIGHRLRNLIADHGPDAVALFVGTQSYTASLTHSFMNAWFRAIGSTSLYSTMTIDQSAKWVADGRIGVWEAGPQRFEDSDVWMLVGTNPLVSMQGGMLTGFPIHDGSRRLRAAKRDGMRLVVIDPRRTEVAAQADLHLQPIPGTDPILLAAMAHVILRDGLEDPDFCDRWVDDLDALRTAVEPLTPDVAASICGVDAASITAAAHLFGRAGRGMARSGTGPDMGPWSNLAEHMVQVLDVVCGRYPREGDVQLGTSVLAERRPGRAQVIGPRRSWESGPTSATGWGQIFGQYPSGALPEEILDGGDRRVRALVVVGGNPVAAFPDPARTTAALRSLDLLVTIDPYPSQTAALADYVIAPALSLERPDHTRGYEHLYSEPFAQWTDAVLPRPPGTVEDWEFFHDLAAAMDLTLQIGSNTYEPDGAKPTSAELLATAARRSRIAYDEVQRHPSGVVVEGLDPVRVAAPADDAQDRFVTMAPDVAAELAAALDDLRAVAPGTSLRLTVRRAKESMNSVAAEASPNPCRLHPLDMERLGLGEGDAVTVRSAHGAIDTTTAADTSLRPGVATMTHCIEPNPAQLLSLTDGRQSINAMPWMTGVPVDVAARDVADPPTE
jgi:anaerobic selenocysteine-containing dehydrogenase